MDELEKIAIKRDRGFLVRLVMLLLLGVLAGGFIFNLMTGANVGGCVANAFLLTAPAENKK